MSITTPALTVERATGSTGARIRGVDLNAVDDATFDVIREALLQHGVVHLPGQDVTPAAHKAFGERFGELHTHPAAPGVEGHPEILLLENRGKSRTITEVWHSDVSCEAKPPAILDPCCPHAVRFPVATRCGRTSTWPTTASPTA